MELSGERGSIPGWISKRELKDTPEDTAEGFVRPLNLKKRIERENHLNISLGHQAGESQKENWKLSRIFRGGS